MPVVALPDFMGALVARLRSFPEITALVATSAGWDDERTTPRVSNEWQRHWKMPTHAILLQEAGGPGQDVDLPIQRARFDLHCVGSTMLEAARLWRIAHACLCPPQGTPRQFVAASTRFYSIDQEGGVMRMRPPSTAWPEAVSSYLATYAEVPA